MKVWATAKSIKREIVDVTNKYLDLFGVHMPQYTRKYGDGVTGTLVYNTGKLLECIEKEVRFPTIDNPDGYGPHIPARQIATVAGNRKEVKEQNHERKQAGDEAAEDTTDYT